MLESLRIRRIKRENDDDHKPLGLKSPFVEVEIEGKESIFIRKRTAVWLFQDTERVYLQIVCYKCMQNNLSQKKKNT